MSRFALTILISFALLMISLVVFILVLPNWLHVWFWYMWGPLFLISIGIPWLWGNPLEGMKFLKPDEPGLGLLIALVASMLIALAYKGITLL
jgi:hypothetical protein